MSKVSLEEEHFSLFCLLAGSGSSLTPLNYSLFFKCTIFTYDHIDHVPKIVKFAYVLIAMMPCTADIIQ